MALDHKELLQRYTTAKSVRARYEDDWKMNLLYLSGQQHRRVASPGQIVKRAYPNSFPVVTRNVMGKIHQINMAKMLRTKPTVTALPLTDQQRDVVIANDVSAWFAQADREDDNDGRVRDLVDWQMGVGNGLLKTYWCTLDNKPKSRPVPPFEVAFDPYAKSVNSANWVIHTQFLSPEKVRLLYPLASRKALTTSKRNSQDLVHADTFTGGRAQSADIEGVILHEYWERPWRGRPKGLCVVFTDHDILQAVEFPYHHNTLPFSHAGHIKRTDSIWCRSHNDGLRDLQDEVNRVEGQIIEDRSLAHGKWYIPPGLQLNEQPNGDPRQILIGLDGSMPGIEPQLIPGLPVNHHLMGEPDRYAWAMSDYAGQHEVSSGGVPGRVEAASAIQLLQETDDSVMQDARHNLDQCIEEAARQRLMLLRQFQRDEITIKVYDKKGQFSGRKLRPSDIKPEQRVVVRSTSGLPQSIAGRRDTVMQLWGNKIIQDPRQALELLQINPEEIDLLSDQADRTKAVRENETIRTVTKQQLSQVTEQGDPIPFLDQPDKYDNHAVHLQIHTQFKLSDEYEALPLEVRDFVDQHMAKHEEYQRYLLGQEALNQQILQGLAPPPPDPDIVPTTPEAVAQQPEPMPAQGGAPPPVVPPQPSPGVAVPQSPDLQQTPAPSAPSAPALTTPGG